MQTMMECELKAENCAAAALASYDVDDRLEYIRLSAVWRNEGLRIDLSEQAHLLSCCPFSEEQLIVV